MPTWIWISTLLFISTLIIFDLCVLHKGKATVSVKDSLFWTGLWICVALAFNIVIFYLYQGQFISVTPTTPGLDGKAAVIEFLTAYLVEYSLSIDNIFVIALIITKFNIPHIHQPRLLFWGVFGAAVLRGIMILLGASLIATFSWIIYVFGLLLIFSAVKILLSQEGELDIENNFFVKITRRLYPVSKEMESGKFFVMENGRKAATPIFMALLLIESCDVMFAIDSIPAVFAITREPFIVFTSNIFAILGLRSLYFALAGLMQNLRFLKPALVFLLVYIGVKMLLSHHYPIPNLVSLTVIVSILGVGVIASLLSPGKKPERSHPFPVEDQV